MNSTFKKTIATITAIALTAGTATFLPQMTKAADSTSTKYEFENGKVTGSAAIQKSGSERYTSGASNDSFVFIENAGDTASVTVPVTTSGSYEVYIGYSAPFGTKTNSLSINNADQGNISFAETKSNEWKEIDFGTVKLNSGDNTFTIVGSWGWTDLDYIRIEEASLPEVKATDQLTADPNATSYTKGLFAYMNSVYGKNVISGQQEYYNASREDEFNYISTNTGGKLPVIRGFDLGNTDPLYKTDFGETKRMISWANDKGGIVETTWHVNVPTAMADYTPGKTLEWSKTTYTEKTDFVTSNCWVKGTKEYEFFEDAVSNLADALKTVQDAGVPVLFRPFHEASGGGDTDGSGAWFWWGKEGTTVYKYLYQYLFNKLTKEYGLHNLIWEFNSYTNDGGEEWYPGDDYVDIIGYDKYNATDGNPNESSIASTFYKLIKMYDSKKMITLMECDTIPSVENITADNAYWGYFMPWYDNHLYQRNSKDTLNKIYNSDLVITLDEVPDYKTFKYPTATRAAVTTGTAPVITTTTTAAIPDNVVAGSFDKKGNITFKQAIGDSTINVVLNIADSNITAANGGFGVSTQVNGIYYWINFQWEKGSGNTVSFKLDNPLNITYNEGKSTLESTDGLYKQVLEVAKKTMTGQFQTWFAGDSDGNALESSSVSIGAAYLSDSTTASTTTTTKAVTTTKVKAGTTTTAVKVNPDDSDISSILQDMGAGWNYGNSLDATTSGITATVSSETAWGNAKATKELFDALKAKGFKSVRIPVTWYQHLDKDYNIDSAWLDRVEEVVKYAYDDGLYVIINTHHENFIENKNIGSDYTNISKELTAIWKQVATRFANYDRHIIFEGMNEPRAAYTDHEWWGPKDSEIESINKLNQDFVNTVRSVDSPYKDSRILMVTPYCASSDITIFSKLVVPKDPNVVVSIHGYLPYNLCMSTESSVDHSKFTDSDKNSLDLVFSNIRKTFLDKGIHVIIGEYGSSDFDSNVEARTQCETYYTTLGKKYGIPMFLWDNDSVGTSGGEHHYYIKRNTKTPASDLWTWYSESEPIVDGIIGVQNDSSIVFGSEGISPVITHKDISSGKALSTASKDLVGSDPDGGNCSENVDFSWDMIKGKEVAVVFSGDTPKVAMMDSNWKNWSDSDPYDVADGIAYFSEDQLKKAWTGTDTDPAHLCAAIYSGNTTIKGIYLIDKATTTVVTTTTTTAGKTTTTTTTTTKATTTNGKATTTKSTTTTSKLSDDMTVPAGDVSLWGDVNADGTQTITDVVLLNRALSGNAQVTGQGIINANLYQVGSSKTSIDSNDSEYLMRLLVSLVSANDLPITK